MNLRKLIDRRPIIVALAGPNGAGKSTFYETFLSDSGLRFINADRLARDLELDPYDAAELANRIRRELVASRESFVFETVFSDPVGDKIAFLKAAVLSGYTVVVCFVGLDSPTTSDERVAMRVSQDGHNVPTRELQARFPRTLKNLERAIRELPIVLVYDNSDLRKPYRLVVGFHDGAIAWGASRMPQWFAQLLDSAD